MPRKTDPIKQVKLKDGTIRYRFVIDVGRRPDGGRDQRTFTFPTQKEAKAERARIISEQAKGTYVAPSKMTLKEFLDGWLDGRRNLKRTTKRGYRDALKHVVDELGTVKLHELNKPALDRLVKKLLTKGRRVGNKRSTALSPTTVKLTLRILAMALDSAMKQGLLGRNVARLVEVDNGKKKPRKTWTAEQAAAFLNSIVEDRLYAAWLLSMYGFRRGEVLGLKWSDIDLKGTLAKERGLPHNTPSIVIQNTRVDVDGVAVDEDPKSENSIRTLPVPDDLVTALKALKRRQAEEKLAAGVAYEDHGLVVVNELGVPPARLQWYSDRFQIMARRAGLPVIRLHDARHTCGTLMHLRGVPAAAISAWLGHASVAFTMRTYVHSQNDALVDAGKTLKDVFGQQAV